MPAPKTAKPPEKMTKGAILDALGRKLTKDELIAFYHAVAHGYRPYAHVDPTTGVQAGYKKTNA